MLSLIQVSHKTNHLIKTKQVYRRKLRFHQFQSFKQANHIIILYHSKEQLFKVNSIITNHNQLGKYEYDLSHQSMSQPQYS